MSTKNLLLWEKYRPKSIDDIILLPRIKSHFENSKHIKDVKLSAHSEEIVLYNARKVIEAISEIGL